MKIQPQFTFDHVAFDKDTEAHLVIGLTAPAIDWQEKRQRICIIPCIDISGSMSGQKLYYAKQAALKLIEQLAPGDYAGLVTFSDQGRVDFSPCEMTQARKDELRAVIGKIHIEGGTNFSDGMLKALESAKRLDLPASIITRVVMLTDGQPTHGIAKDSKSLNALLEKQMGHVTLSAFGFGTDPDQALLSTLSEVGKGNYAFIDNPDKALAAFGKELGGLLSTYAQSILVEVTPSNGHIITEVVSDVETEEEVDGEVSLKVPSILAEETNNLVLAVRLSAQKQPGPRQVNAFNVKVTFQRLAEDGSVIKEEVETKAKIQFVKADDAQKQPTKEVDEIVARAQLVKAQIEAEKAADRGDFKTAGQVFQAVAASFQDRGHAGLVGATNHIGVLYDSASSYSTNAGRRTALRSATSRGSGTSSMDSADEVVLSAANYSLSNSAQEGMTQAFVGGGSTAAPDLSAQPAVDIGGFVGFGSTAAHLVSGTPVGVVTPHVTGPAVWVAPIPAPSVHPQISPVVAQVAVRAEPAPAPKKSKKKLSKAKSKRW